MSSELRNIEKAIERLEREVGNVIPARSAVKPISSSPFRLAQINVSEHDPDDQNAYGYIKDNAYGNFTIWNRQSDLLQISIEHVGTLIEHTFKLKFYDGSVDPDTGEDNFEISDPIDGDCGARGLQIILRRMESIGDDVICYCGPLGTGRTVYCQFTGKFAGEDVREFIVVENTVGSNESPGPNIVVGHAKAASTNPNDKVTAFMINADANGEIEFHNNYVGKIVWSGNRWETSGNFYPPTRCTPYVTTNLGQPAFTDGNFSSDGDGDASWSYLADNPDIFGRPVYQCTFTSAQLTAGQCFTDTLILTGLSAAPAIKFGAYFTDDIHTAIQLNFITGSSGVPWENVRANIVNATLIDTNINRQGVFLLPDYANANRVIEGSAGESHHQYGPPNWSTSLSGDVTLSNLYGPPVSGSPLSTGWNVADDSDTVVNGLIDGSLGVAIQIEAHITNLINPIPDVTINVTQVGLQILYET